jgi:hypothetical protein
MMPTTDSSVSKEFDVRGSRSGATDRGGRIELPWAPALCSANRLAGSDLNNKTPALGCTLYFRGASARIRSDNLIVRRNDPDV